MPTDNMPTDNMPNDRAKKFRAPHTGMGGVVRAVGFVTQVIIYHRLTSTSKARTRSEKHARRCAKRFGRRKLTPRCGTIGLGNAVGLRHMLRPHSGLINAGVGRLAATFYYQLGGPSAATIHEVFQSYSCRKDRRSC
jgi:hypothetical protein